MFSPPQKDVSTTVFSDYGTSLSHPPLSGCIIPTRAVNSISTVTSISTQEIYPTWVGKNATSFPLAWLIALAVLNASISCLPNWDRDAQSEEMRETESSKSTAVPGHLIPKTAAITLSCMLTKTYGQRIADPTVSEKAIPVIH
jgi:hypothetical protein